MKTFKKPDGSIIAFDENDLRDLPFMELCIAEGGVAITEQEADSIRFPAKPLSALKILLSAAIDNRIAEIYSNWMRFEAEYKEREVAARAFAQANFTGSPGIWVTAFATAAGKTNRVAAELIITQADGLRAALASLGALRMRKYEIVAAESAEVAQQKHDEIIAAAETIAAGLQ